MWLFLTALAAEPDAASQVQALLPLVEETRGLASDEPIAAKILTPEQATERMAEGFLPEEIVRFEHESVLLRQIGLLDQDYDFQTYLQAFTRNNVGGFWDVNHQDMVVISKHTQHIKRIVRHELVHALQDQRFDIRVRTDGTIPNDDLITAFSMLMEGDAAYTDALINADASSLPPFPRQVPPQPEMALPRFQQEEMAAQYTLGPWYVQQLHTEGGWEAVNQAYDHPPLSTEMVLHPEKRSGPDIDYPQRIEFQPWPGYSSVYENTFGELSIALALRLRGSTEPWTQAEGWDGDRFALLERDGQTVVVWRSVWDQPHQAARFAESARSWLERVDPDVVVDLQGVGVVVVSGAPPGASAKLVQRAWKAKLTEAHTVVELLGREPSKLIVEKAAERDESN